MTKNEFKQGDRVRFTGDYDHYVESTLEKGEEYTVTYVDSVGNCDLSVPCTAYSINAEDLELVEPLDRKTAFLTRLQSLMREYNAKIECWQSDFESVAMAINIGDDTVEYDSGDKSNLISVTPDNIMDFDKE